MYDSSSTLEYPTVLLMAGVEGKYTNRAHHRNENARREEKRSTGENNGETSWFIHRAKMEMEERGHGNDQVSAG